MIANSLEKGNSQCGDGTFSIVEDGKRNINHTIHFIARSFFVSPRTDSGQVGRQITRRTLPILFTPNLDGPGTNARRLMRKYDMSCSRMHQIDNRSGSNVETGTGMRVDLRNNDNMSTLKHSQMARLAYFMRDLLHDWQRLGDHAFGWRMLLN